MLRGSVTASWVEHDVGISRRSPTCRTEPSSHYALEPPERCVFSWTLDAVSASSESTPSPFVRTASSRGRTPERPVDNRLHLARSSGDLSELGRACFLMRSIETIKLTMSAQVKGPIGEHDMSNLMTQIPAAAPAVAVAHFEGLLSLETDCWDVHESMKDGSPDFVLLHVNGDQAGFDSGHIPGAVFFHHSLITKDALADFPMDTLFVVYCAGPHCNAADRAAARLARLGRPVKKMIGGRVGWLDEGFDLVTT